MKTGIKRRIFVSGASGFIGANLTRALLNDNYSVHVLERNIKIPWRLKDISDSITIHHGDITNVASLKNALSKINPNYIVHLATYGSYYYQTELEKIMQVNIRGTINLLEASADIPYKCFINTGSSSEYGYKINPMREEDSCNPVSYYAATKLSATHICKIFANLNKKPIVTLRPFSVYGPYEEPGRFVPTIIKSLITKKSIKLTPGDQRRDFIYIDDLSNAYLRALELGTKMKGEVFNIGTGIEHSNDEVVNKLFETTRRKTSIEKGAYPKRNWDSSHWVADSSHARKILSWRPIYSLDKGLGSTYSWFEKNIELYKR